jgi:hypothetical protein
MSDIFESLNRALEQLRATGKSLEYGLSPHTFQMEPKIAAVTQRLLYRLEEKKPHSVVPAAEIWDTYCQSTNPCDFTQRELRTLAWEPAIVEDERFLEYLARRVQEPGPSLLAGLLFSLHARWRHHIEQGIFPKIFCELVMRCSASSGTIKQYRSNISLVTEPSGPVSLANIVVNQEISVEDALRGFSIPQNTEFHECALVESIRYASSKAIRSDSVAFIIEKLLRSPHLGKTALSGVLYDVLNAAQRSDRDGLLIERALDFVLLHEHLGDPRIYPQRWLTVDKRALELATQLLSREDIEFFFHLAMEADIDRHHRKDFWLRYIGQMKRSRPILCDEDVYRHRSALDKIVARGRKIDSFTYKTESSAFIIDFGSVIVVEFSRTNNSCYFYKPEKFEKLLPKGFWQKAPFHITLKSTYHQYQRIGHSSGWQARASGLLAEFGIRPDRG